MAEYGAKSSLFEQPLHRLHSRSNQLYSLLRIQYHEGPVDVNFFAQNSLSYLFQKTLGLQYDEALIFLAALTGVYLVMGGYFAVAVSDFIRGIVEFFGVLTMLLLLLELLVQLIRGWRDGEWLLLLVSSIGADLSYILLRRSNFAEST